MFRVFKYALYVVLVLIVVLAGYISINKVPDIPVAQLKDKWAPAPSQFVDINGLQVHLRDEGPKDDTQPILLIHGTGASLHTWDGWVETLKVSRRVIRFDLPAFGLTGPEPTNNYKIEHYAKVVVSVLDKLNIQQAVVAGNSLGGYISWATAVLYPERVAKLVLVDASGYPYDAKSIPIGFKLSSNPLMGSVLKGFLPMSLVARSVRNVYGNPELVTDDLVERYYELTLREGNRQALKQRFIQTLPGPLAAKVPSIQVPTLLIWGEKDLLIPVKFGERFDQEIPNSELIVFKELGHVPHEEDPKSTVKVVQDFLAAH
ncbi:alpha/beta fold hydrolase [Oceaniserpentilla sp. 4NH20-0058]|uniref:alpha/beta fold hydrolase n=1 Tax=Oceaniserpentilla sp. 4NH20-0058 TaxID=3127660 RepID=UPI00310A6E29